MNTTHRLGLMLVLALGHGCAGTCENPEPLLIDGVRTGYVACDDGTHHRQAAVPTDPSFDTNECTGDEKYLNCRSDADCTGPGIGKCHSGMTVPMDETVCHCQYSCEADSDCGTNQICVPKDFPGSTLLRSTCIDATCTTDDDCARGECGIGTFPVGTCYAEIDVACRTVKDTCRTKDDCAKGEHCEYSVDEDRFLCAENEGCVY